jgi:FMN-dependent NADH-azoreductase
MVFCFVCGTIKVPTSPPNHEGFKMNILQINSSARPDASHSSRLANELVQRLLADTPEASLKVRDLGRTPHPMLDEPALQALFTPAEQRTPAQAERVALDDALIAEIFAADSLVLAVPMYNFGITAQLKNWIDAISRAQVTFRYTANGPEGLLKGKKAYVVLTRGGLYRNTPNDTQTPYLKTFLGFLGITDVQFIFAEGLAMGPDAEHSAFTSATEQMAQLV